MVAQHFYVNFLETLPGLSFLHFKDFLTTCSGISNNNNNNINSQQKHVYGDWKKGSKMISFDLFTMNQRWRSFKPDIMLIHKFNY